MFCVDCRDVGNVARIGENATDFCGFVGRGGRDDGGGSFGLVKSRRQGAVLIEGTAM